MSDLHLLVFGCAVSFIAVAGAYTFIREPYTGARRSPEPETPPAAAVPKPLPRSA
ncbi:MAG TPA: hypothetical protein VMW35_02160 [Myxococcota bacterium]|jgi:hypothetical protein|nr:hypothetical protein [Myxococcota bacterium]